jgi:hypothetical protein
MKIAEIVFGFGMIVGIILCSGLANALVQFASAGETAPTWSVRSSIEVTNGSMKSAVCLGGNSNVSAGIIMEANNSTLQMVINTGDSASISGNINASSGDYIYAESYAENQNNSAMINVSVAESNLLNMTMNTEASSEKTSAAGNLSAAGNNIWLGAYSNDTELYRGFFKEQIKGLLYADEYSGFFIPFKLITLSSNKKEDKIKI